MDLESKKILFVMYWSLEYGGSLITSWKYFAEKLSKDYGIEVAWVFPEQKDSDWLIDLKNNYKVFFIKTHNVFSTTNEFKKILHEYQPDIVHSHFELYDIPVARAIKQFNPNIKMVWHIHDNMDFNVKGQSFPVLRYLRRRLIYALRYHVYGKNAWFVPVSYEMAHFANHFRNHFFTVPSAFDAKQIQNDSFVKTTPLLNGVPLSRLGPLPPKRPERIPGPFRFLTFGANFHRKGIATLLDAGKILNQRNNNFEFIITKGNYLEESIRDYMGEPLPSWLKLIPQTENVGKLFLYADCYVSTAIAETMAFAIAEAELFLLPVIQNDIPGTLWNAEMPSVLLYPKKDASALADKMEIFMKTAPQEWSEKTIQTRKKIQELFDLDCWSKRIMDVYRGL